MMTSTNYHDMFAADREAARKTVKSWREAVATLDSIQSNDVVMSETPAHTVKCFVAEVGEGLARFVIASLVNRSAWDGRIYPAVKEWAASEESSLDEGACRDASIYSNMHMAHLNQVAQAMMQYQPEPAEEVTEATETESGESAAAPAFTISHNDEFNSTEVIFAGKPSEEIRSALKALRFRWHGQRRVWYGYATEEATRAAIEGKQTDTAPQKPAKAARKASTAQDHLRIYWNGIKIDGGKLIKCSYSIDNNADNAQSVTIYARDYSNLPRDILPVKNDSDIYTDYFEHDRAYLTPEHPLYKYFRFAAAKARIRELKAYIADHEKRLAEPERWSGQHEFYREENEKNRARVAAYESIEDPGQPSAEDLAEIDRQKQEAENARRAAEHEEELRRREAYLRQKSRRAMIEAEAEAHPVQDGAPAVCINWSEHPAFEKWADDELVLSVAAADKVLRELDAEQHETRETPDGAGWYYKTKFTITGNDNSGEAFTYTGRYDLGDGDGGLIEHIRAFGEYFLTHDNFGHEKAEPDETNETVQLAAFLSQFARA